MKLVWVLFLAVYFSTNVKCETEKKRATSGPYQTILTRVDKCEKTSYPINKDPPMTLLLKVYNSTTKTLMMGNITVTREQRHVKMKMKSYMWRNGKWEMTYLMNNIGCHGMLLHMLMAVAGVKYDRENCAIPKGKYTFRDLDVDPIQHIWTSKMEYGKVLWTSEVTIRSSTIYCWEYETLVKPLDSS